GYLEACHYPEKGYWNLYTFPENEVLARIAGQEKVGWYETNQLGRGAVALVFSRDAVVLLLKSQTIVQKPTEVNRPTSAVDGAVVCAMRIAGWKEYCHYPSLTQHVGDVSSMGNPHHPKSNSFRGEGFDALTLLQEQQPAEKQICL